jgi:DNA-binding response OmpR family regulator
MESEGRRVLVVDDDALVADALASMLRDAGCLVVGPFLSLAAAWAAARAEAIDAAMIDVNLDGELSFPLADLLTDLGIPVVFVTGDGALARGAYPRRPILAKPFTPDDLRAVLAAL